MKLQYKKAPGINQGWNDLSGGANRILNCRVDPVGLGWLADRGLEPFYKYAGTNTFPATNETKSFLEHKVDSIFVWTKQNTDQVYYLIEQDGELSYRWGNVGTTGIFGDKVVISSNRHIPGLNDIGTQYIPYGNKLIILNGYDAPILFYGREKSRDFSFLLPTPNVELLETTPDYRSGEDLKTGTASPAFTNSPLGLGDLTDGDTSVYSYRMSFLTDTGSESPLGPVTSTSWTIGATAEERRFGVFLTDVPLGSKGVVARKIYRTKNQRLSNNDNTRDQLFYEVLTIRDNSTTQIIDVIPDSMLVNAAPKTTDSTIIDSSYQYAANWNGRLWLCGGAPHPTKIIYSQAGLPEQFPTFNYFDVGNTSGGEITAVYPYYNSLIIFRKNSIELIRDNNGTYTLSQLTPNVGTTATNTIKLVPGIGLVFLSQDGIFAVNGGLDGGSTIQVSKISNQYEKEIQQLNPAALRKAFAVYSFKEKEYWCHFPRRGSDTPTRGIVIHSSNATVSFRGAIDPSDSYLWKFTCGSVDPSGNIIFGTEPTWLLNGAVSNSTTSNAIGFLVGLHVWSGAPYHGYKQTYTGSGQAGRSYSGTQVDWQPGLYESSWIDFGGNSKYSVQHIELQLVAYGDNEVELEWGSDYDTTWNSAGSQKPTKSEVVFTTKEDPVFAPTTNYQSVTKAPFKIGSSIPKGTRTIKLRWDVVTGLVDNFRFRLTSDKQFHLLSFTIHYEGKEQLPLNQNAGSHKGQP